LYRTENSEEDIMLKRSVAITAMLMPLLIVGCGEDPVVTEPSASIRSVFADALPAQAAAPPNICVPFRANGSAGSVQIGGGPPPAPIDITLNAEGRASHLGRYSSSASFVVTFTSPTTAVFDGGGTFTAANGDQLVFTYTGDFFPGPVARGLGSYDVVGGTGRFEGATGSGVFSSGDGHTTFDGDVCFAR
jgi:hypothetical protein